MFRRNRKLATIGLVVLLAHSTEARSQNLNALRIEPRDASGEAKRIDFKEFTNLGSPTFSRDREWIAFDAYNGGYNGAPPECWVVRTDGTQRRKLAVGQTPRWSPDGKQLLLMRCREQDRQLGLGIFLVNADGTGERKICDGRWPDWSPDGKKMTFAVGGSSDRGGAWPRSRICVASVDGNDAEEVALGDCPSWSPDGKMIACCFADPAMPAPLLRVIELETKRQAFAGYGWWRANWSADSKSLLANTVLEGNRPGMAKLGLGQRQKPEPLFANIAGAESPFESADGQRVVFSVPEMAR